MFDKIQRDIPRAFPKDDFYTAEIKASIERILNAYIWRNPTVGYIQGFNFLVFRLRKILNECKTRLIKQLMSAYLMGLPAFMMLE